MGKKKLFDYVIGNPPYNADFDSSTGNRTYSAPIYNTFLDESYKVADKVEMIHPARFLFNAGSTPKAWNEKMLHDTHFKVLSYEQDASKVFTNTDIKGGIAITYHNQKVEYGEIEVFTAYPELNSILHKVENTPNTTSLSNIVITRTAYRLTDEMHHDYPMAITQLSNGHAYDMSTNIFERLPQIFDNTRPDNNHQYAKILGRVNNARDYKYIRRNYINNVSNFDKFKVFISSATGTGSFGEIIAAPIIGSPQEGATETFISIGAFNYMYNAENLIKYIKGKFCRSMLGICKKTQHLTPEVWKFVPVQDFSSSSDIDWSKSIHEIDLQLYKKYGLDDDEINFIETNVKEMS